MPIRVRKHVPGHRGCEHQVIVRLPGHPGFGRCVDCNKTIATPGMFLR